MHQNAFPLAEANDIPHDEEVAGKIEMFDELQFPIDLLPGTFAQIRRLFTVTPIHALARALAQKRDHRLAFWDRITRELITKMFQRELQSA